MRNAGRYAHRIAQLVTRVGDDVLAGIDDLVAQGAVESRSHAVRVGLQHLIDQHRRQRIAETIVAGYRAQPQTPGEDGWPDEASVAMVGDEPW